MLIKESTSPFASNLVLVRMAEMSLRFCVDYSVLNRKTIKNAHAISRVEEALEALVVLLGSQLVTYILYIGKRRWNQTSGTCNIYSRNLSHWEFARMPFRLTKRLLRSSAWCSISFKLVISIYIFVLFLMMLAS